MESWLCQTNKLFIHHCMNSIWSPQCRPYLIYLRCLMIISHFKQLALRIYFSCGRESSHGGATPSNQICWHLLLHNKWQIELTVHVWDCSSHLSDRTRLWKTKLSVNPKNCRRIFFSPTRTPLWQGLIFWDCPDHSATVDNCGLTIQKVHPQKAAMEESWGPRRLRTMREGYVHGLKKDIDHGPMVVVHASLDTTQ